MAILLYVIGIEIVFRKDMISSFTVAAFKYFQLMLFFKIWPRGNFIGEKNVYFNLK